MGAVSALRALTLNSGSSSVKFGLYEVGDKVVEVASGETGQAGADASLFDAIDAALGDRRPNAIGHRIVHGGPDLFAPVRIDDAILARLQRATAFAPLHGPASLTMIAMAQRRYPELPQIACFDTGFHAALPEIAAVLPVPRALRGDGVRRYGFHGLSCQSVVHQLGDDLPERLIIAHLGSGASVTAVRAGRSVDTSMGLTPSGGIVMGTRAGDVDPGLLLYLMRERNMNAAAIEDLIDRQSGMLGISGLSGDLRALHASNDKDAGLAIRIFCRSVAKQIASMMTVLGGAEMIVFTGGIGENDAAVRDAIRADLAWAGVPSGIQRNEAWITVKTVPSQEGEQIARDVLSILGKSTDSA